MPEKVHVTTQGQWGYIVGFERQELEAGDGGSVAAVRWEPVDFAGRVLELEPDKAGKLAAYCKWLGRFRETVRLRRRVNVRRSWLSRRDARKADSFIAPQMKRLGWAGRAHFGNWKER